MIKSNALKNSVVGFASQAVYIVLTFITRTVLLQTLGVEILGLNSTFTSIISTLSLAELGFQTAVVYAFYEPLHNNDLKKINDVLNIFKRVYSIIGIIFIIASIAVSPFLIFILKGVKITPKIYLYFGLHCAATASSYFLAYKRALLYADRKDYVIKLTDTIINVICSLLCITSLILFKDYVSFLIIKIFQVIISNVLLSCKTKKYYPYLHKSTIDYKLFAVIKKNVKDIFAGKIAAYIYTSTDSLVLSAFVSTTSVGYYVNYMTISGSIKIVSNSILQPLIPTIGHLIVSNKDPKEHIKLFNSFSTVRYILSLLLIVPMGVLMQDFISIWVGAKYHLNYTVVILFCMDLYIHIVHSVTCDFISVYGLFSKDKYIEIVGALTNIALSVILVNIYGIIGVLIGTVVSQSLFWIGRSILVFREGFGCSKKTYRYWLECIAYILGFIVVFILCFIMYGLLSKFITSIPLRFVIGGLLCELLAMLYIAILFHNSDGFRLILRKLSRQNNK